jgi:asparagine synthase (glutamine-hydrolysing)
VFAARVGPASTVSEWLEAVSRHAAWLGHQTTTETRDAVNGLSISLSWLTKYPELRAETAGPHPERSPAGSAPDRSHGEFLSTHTSRNGCEFARDLGISVSVDVGSGELAFDVPPTTPEQIFWSRDKSTNFVSTDLRLLLTWHGLDLDERGVYALLQYGAIPPPLTLSRNVNRIPSGATTVLPPPPGDVRPRLSFGIGVDPGPNHTESAEPLDLIRACLANSLAPISVPSTLYFSGGVDSSLIAAEMRSLGNEDLQLVTCTFGDDDLERIQAIALAESLHLPWHEVRFDVARLSDMLGRIGRDYAYPFVDISVIPTNFLVNETLGLLRPNEPVIDGTGADGAFGFWTRQPRWARLMAVPRGLRILVGSMLDSSRLTWRSSRVEYVWRLARRSVQMPAHEAAVTALNSFDGIAYKIPASIRSELEFAIADNIMQLGWRLDPVKQFSLLDLVHVCAGEYAQKTFSPLLLHGATPIYPYLTPELVNLVLALPWDERFTQGENKGLLKSLLAQHVPAELVYRPKHAFGAPELDVFANKSLTSAMTDSVTDSANPIREFCRTSVLRSMIRDASRRRNLTWSAYNLLWAVTFLSLWIHQVTEQRRRFG